jgi:ferritin-like metal-binding protein YciE
MDLSNLTDALFLELIDLYDAEQQLVAKWPALIKAASGPVLKSVFERHYQQTKTHVERLDEVFLILANKPQPATCEVMRCLLKDADEVISASGVSGVKDAVLLGVAQRIEHYEIAGYKTACTFAEELALDEVVDLLQQSLNEEDAAAQKIDTLSKGAVFTAGPSKESDQPWQLYR